MDTIEAANTLANLKRYISGGGVVDRKASEAINMAIRALEVIADPDTVSRKQAIDAAIEAVDEWDGGFNLTRADIIEKALNALPPITTYRL